MILPMRECTSRAGDFGSGELFPAELTTFLLAASRARPTLHAFDRHRRPPWPREAAEAAIAAATGARSWACRLRYKDLYETRGIRTTGGSALLDEWVPDATRRVSRA